MPLPAWLKEKKLFTSQDLLARLKKEGFFCSKKQLWMYEKRRILPQPKRVKVNAWYMRVYTKEELDGIVKICKGLEYKKHIVGLK